MQLSFAYVVTKSTSRSKDSVLRTNDKQEVITFLSSLDFSEVDLHFVNNQVGSEWLFDHRSSPK